MALAVIGMNFFYFKDRSVFHLRTRALTLCRNDVSLGQT
jgi:hypothetical protein